MNLIYNHDLILPKIGLEGKNSSQNNQNIKGY